MGAHVQMRSLECGCGDEEKAALTTAVCPEQTRDSLFFGCCKTAARKCMGYLPMIRWVVLTIVVDLVLKCASWVVAPQVNEGIHWYGDGVSLGTCYFENSGRHVADLHYDPIQSHSIRNRGALLMGVFLLVLLRLPCSDNSLIPCLQMGGICAVFGHFGNMVDRAAFGFVVDYIAFANYCFNLSDIVLGATTGVGILVVVYGVLDLAHDCLELAQHCVEWVQGVVQEHRLLKATVFRQYFTKCHSG